MYRIVSLLISNNRYGGQPFISIYITAMAQSYFNYVMVLVECYTMQIFKISEFVFYKNGIWNGFAR